MDSSAFTLPKRKLLGVLCCLWLTAGSIGVETPCTGTCLTVNEQLKSGQEWIDIGSFKNVSTYVKNFVESDLLAVRGISDFEVHISMTLSPFFNSSANPLW